MRPQRLEDMARHLESGVLGHKVFDFATYNNACSAHCGTVGCAIGEAPILWPEDWEFGETGSPRLKTSRDEANHLRNIFVTRKDAQFWFGITDEQYAHLFELALLPASASRYDVAAGIRRFLAETV